MFSAIGRAAIGRIGGGRTVGRVQRQAQRVQTIQRLQSNYQGRAHFSLLSGRRLYSAAATKATKESSTSGSTDKPAKKRASSTEATTKKAKKPAAKKVKKELTEKQQEKKAADEAKAALKAQKRKEKKAVEDGKAKIRDLKAKVLVPPTRLPSTAWTVLLVENAKKDTEVTAPEAAKNASTRYQSMDASAREHYNQLANENKASNEANYKSWTASLTPQQIHDSNFAQQRLKKLGLIPAGRKLKIDDPRIPKKAWPPFIHFVKERYGSGDFKGIHIAEAVKILSQEFKLMPESEKKHYEELYASQRQVYIEEMASTFPKTKPTSSVEA